MKSIDNKKAQTLDGAGLIDCQLKGNKYDFK